MTAEERVALKEAQRKANKKDKILLGIKIGAFVLVVAGLIFLIVRKGSNAGKIKTDFIQTGVIDKYFDSELTFIRTEYEVTSLGSGRVIPAVNEGDKVAAGSLVAHVVKDGYEDELEKLREIESKIAVAINASSYIGSDTNVELIAINEKIDAIRQKISRLSLSGDISKYSECIKELKTALEVKNNILANIDSPNAYVKELQAERDVIYNGLADYMNEITAPYAGVVSFHIDGNQNTSSINTKKIIEYTKSEMGNTDTLTQSVTEFKNNEMQYMYGKSVTHGDVIARITPDVTYYISVDCTEAQAGSISVGDHLMLRSEARDYSVTADVVAVFLNGSKSSVLLETSSGLASSLSNRKVKGDVILSYTEGIKVVRRCLSEIDSAGVTARIAIVRSGYVEFVYVNILASDGEYVIISNKSQLSQGDDGISVRINDQYVINHEDVREGQVIE